tara:strand:+ start:1019 stop:1297 length:279 start_codon:yes stop_codon:yes gene_type:complete
MKKQEMINKITEAVKETHNEQDLIDLNEMSYDEIVEIMNDLELPNTLTNIEIIEEAKYKIDMGHSNSHIVNFVMMECQNDKRANFILNYIYK